jgi:hypothetical protein
MLSAGRKVSKKPYNNGKPFSDKLTQIAKTFRQKKNLLRYLIQKNENERNRDTEAQVQMQIREAYLSLKEVQRNAEKERKRFLSKLADKRASEWNLSHNAALNVILQSEASKNTFARHGYVMTKQKTGSIENLTIPIPKYADTEKETEKAGWATIDDEETVFALLLRKNAQQLMRSSTSPFAAGSIVDACGIDGNKHFTQKLLDGTISDYEINRLTKDSEGSKEELNAFIRALAKPRNTIGTFLPDFEWEYGIKEFCATFRRTRESTSCGPSGLNMSYWKAVSEDDDIARVHSLLIEKAFRHGFSYPRWQESWHCMLQKKDKPYIHRLRIIQLFEGDFNGALKYLLGRLLMYHIVKNDECDKQAFGSIPGRTAHDALITLQLLYDNARINKTVIASMFNDAAGCYDRIRPLLSSICMWRVGCPGSVAYCHGLTQRKMIHRVKTNRGISKGYISWGPYQTVLTASSIAGVLHLVGNIGGIGQGGGASPVGWLAVLLVMMITYRRYVSGVTLRDPIDIYSLALYLISYVDDNTLVESFDRELSMASILVKLQNCIQRWHKILRITGGDLALEKCTFCIMKWKWKAGVASLETPSSDLGDLIVAGTNIARLRPKEGT